MIYFMAYWHWDILIWFFEPYDAACCPHLDLLYGYLTDEEKEQAKEKVTTIDEGIATLSFSVTRFVLCKMINDDKSQNSWEKIMAIDIQPE